MNPFILPAGERLADWKRFRRSLSAHPEIEQIGLLCTYFARVPLRNIAYDIDQPATWPTMWEMIDRNDWCRNSAAIGIAGTMRLAGWHDDRFELAFIQDRKSEVSALVVEMDSGILLNYEWGVPVRRPTSLRTLNRYSWNGRAYSLD